MFIRRTQTRRTATGERYFSHRLVRSERIDGRVKQRTLLNLGRHFDVAQEHWPMLCARIEQLLGGEQPALLELDLPETLEREAQRCVSQLLVRQQAPSPASEPVPVAADLQSVDVDSLELLRPRSVGVEQVGLWAMRQVGFEPLLEGLGFNGPQRAAVIGSIIARMAAPGSERAAHQWLGTHSGLGELLDWEFETMPAIRLYRASDRLYRHRERIESSLFARVSDLFGLTSTITLYDLTNTYFEGAVADNPKGRRGHSKEKRSDCPLVTLGLVLDASGFVRRSEVFAGNAVESTTLASMLKGLAAPRGALVVMDRGVATEKNLAWLREHGYRYLVVSRERSRRFDPARACTIETASGQSLQLQKVLSEDGQEVRLYCHSEARERKEEGINTRFAERFEAGLNKIAEGLSKPLGEKRLDKLWERIGRLKARSRGAGQHYRIRFETTEDGNKALALHWERVPTEGSAATHPGVYCLRSSETDWDEERLWRTYVTLTDLEAVFRSLKSELGLRPIYHRKEERVDGHLFITVLAYQFVQIIRRHLREQGITESWSRLRQTLSGQCRVTATFRRSDGRTLHVRKATRAEPGQLALYKALDLDPAPGGTKKMVV